MLRHIFLSLALTGCSCVALLTASGTEPINQTSLLLAVQSGQNWQIESRSVQADGGQLSSPVVLTPRMSFPVCGLAFSGAVDGNAEVFWAYHNIRQDSYAVPISSLRNGKFEVVKHLASDWKRKIISLAVAPVGSVAESGIVFIATEGVDGKSRIGAFDAGDFRQYHYVGAFNEDTQGTIQAMVVGTLGAESSPELLIAWQNEGRQFVDRYEFALMDGRRVATRHKGRLLTTGSYTIRSIAIGDMNADGLGELLLLRNGERSIRVYLPDAPITVLDAFKESAALQVNSSVTDIAIGLL